jgi:small subunit ribosomal protein S3
VFKGEIFGDNAQPQVTQATADAEPEKKVRKPRAKDATTV